MQTEGGAAERRCTAFSPPIRDPSEALPVLAPTVYSPPVPRLLEEIDWASPVLQLPDDPEWADELTQRLGSASACYMYTAPSRWLREGLVQAVQMELRHLPKHIALQVMLVTSQENACRYCYGAARQFLTLHGISKRRIDEIERDVKVASTDQKEYAALQFARNLSRSSPRPSRRDVDTLLSMGYAPEAVEEIALYVVIVCLTNRVATFIAAPLETEEPVKEGLMGRLMRPLVTRLQKRPRPPAPAKESTEVGPYAPLLDLVSHTAGVPLLARMLGGAMNSSVLPRRTVAWMFAAVATALDCELCSQSSRRLLELEGIPKERIDTVLHSLAGPELDETESILLPWVRETVHYQTEVIQRRSHELAKLVDDYTLLEAIGVASLANACARLSMLRQ